MGKKNQTKFEKLWKACSRACRFHNNDMTLTGSLASIICDVIEVDTEIRDELANRLQKSLWLALSEPAAFPFSEAYKRRNASIFAGMRRTRPYKECRYTYDDE